MGTQKRKREAVFAGEKEKHRKEGVQEELHQLWKGSKA